jgi:hypothetical protein
MDNSPLFDDVMDVRGRFYCWKRSEHRDGHMMARHAGPHKGVNPLHIAMFSCALAALLGGCGSVPGETLASGGVRRDVTRRILAQANAAEPTCKNQRIRTAKLQPSAGR